MKTTTTKAAMSTDKNPARPKPSSAFSNVRDRARTRSNTDSLLSTTTGTAKITNFNSDTVCLSTDNNNSNNKKKKNSNIVTWFQRIWYSISVHNGTYMMNPTERWTIHTALFLGTAFGLLYLYVFGKGLIDGMMVAAQAAAGAASEDNDVHA